MNTDTVREYVRAAQPATDRWSDQIAVWSIAAFAFAIPNDTLLHAEIGLGLARFGAVLIVVTTLVDIASTRRLPRLDHQPVFLAVVGAWALWHLISAAWTLSGVRTTTTTGTAIQIAVITAIILDRICTPERAFLVLRAFVAGTALAIADVVIRFSDEPTQLGSAYHAPTGADPNAFAGWVVIAGAAAAFLLAASGATTTRWGRIGLVSFLAFCPLALLASFSRAGAVSAALGLLVTIAVLAKRSPLLAGGVVVGASGLGLLGAVIVGDQIHLNRYIGLIDSSIGTHESVETRIDLAGVGWRAFLERPLHGHGAGSFPELSLVDGPQRAMVAHNSYVDMAAELGLVGIALFVAAIVLPVWKLMSLRPPAWLQATLMTVLAAIMAGTISWQYDKALWLMAVLCLALSRRELVTQAEMDEPQPLATA